MEPRLAAGGAGRIMVIWLVGLSGAGKTTIGRELHALWRVREPNTVLVDGDEIRAIFGHDRHPDAYSLAGRRANAERIGELCLWLDRQGMNVVCCILSAFEDSRAWMRRACSSYLEVFVDAPLDVLVARDTKGLYAEALRGERRDVVGVDLPFERPVRPDLVLDSSAPGADARAMARAIHARATGAGAAA